MLACQGSLEAEVSQKNTMVRSTAKQQMFAVPGQPKGPPNRKCWSTLGEKDKAIAKAL